MSTPQKPKPALYILYNATSTLFGKLQYGYRKLTCSTPEDPTCAACDITHGGLHLDETAAWKAAKNEIVGEKGGMEVRQLHKDEVDEGMRKWIESRGLVYPMVLLLRDKERGEYEVVMDRAELARLGGDSRRFMGALREKRVLQSKPTGLDTASV